MGPDGSNIFKFLIFLCFLGECDEMLNFVTVNQRD